MSRSHPSFFRHPRRWGLLLAAAMWLGFFQPASAAGQAPLHCPGSQGEPLPESGERHTILAELVKAGPYCNNDALYLAYRGALLLSLGEVEEAAAFLERALLLNPDLGGAQIDYAQALARQGDARSATALMTRVLAREDLPPLLRPGLQEQLEQLDLASAWRGAAVLTWRSGYDSNLSGAPARDQLTLTHPDGDVLLTLNEKSREKAGAAQMLEGITQWQHPLSRGARVLLRAEWRLRDAAGQSADYQQLDLGSTAIFPIFAAGNLLLTAAAGNFRYARQNLSQTGRIGLARDWLGLTCLPRLGLEFEQRTYPTSPLLDSRFAAINSTLQCPLGSAHTSLTLRYGEDQPEAAARPGGRQQRLDTRLGYARPWRQGRLESEFSLTLLRDSEGYSPLLEHHAIRQQQRAYARIEYSRPVNSDWEAVVTGELSYQRSNLALFEQRGTVLWFGLRRYFGSR